MKVSSYYRFIKIIIIVVFKQNLTNAWCTADLSFFLTLFCFFDFLGLWRWFENNEPKAFPLSATTTTPPQKQQTQSNSRVGFKKNGNSNKVLLCSFQFWIVQIVCVEFLQMDLLFGFWLFCLSTFLRSLSFELPWTRLCTWINKLGKKRMFSLFKMNNSENDNKSFFVKIQGICFKIQ